MKASQLSGSMEARRRLRKLLDAMPPDSYLSEYFLKQIHEIHLIKSALLKVFIYYFFSKSSLEPVDETDGPLIYFFKELNIFLFQLTIVHKSFF